MTDDLESNVEPLTPELLATRTIQRYGKDAKLHASMQAAIFDDRGNDTVAKIWKRAARIIDAVRKLKEDSGGSLEDYKDGSLSISLFDE